MTTDELERAIELAAAGVDYSPRYGAVCPLCGTPRARVTGSLPWDGNIKVRYHRCANQECRLARLKVSIKSVEVDNVGGREEAWLSSAR